MPDIKAWKMRWQNIKQQRWFTIITNKFVLATIAFVVWMLFLDVNSYLIHSELNAELDELNQSIEYYEREIAHDRQRLKELTTQPEMLEKFAREQYWMHRPGEEIYLIDHEKLEE